ncbi:MAG: hypothetical protein QM749_03015 [Aquabacterium sp.]
MAKRTPPALALNAEDVKKLAEHMSQEQSQALLIEVAGLASSIQGLARIIMADEGDVMSLASAVECMAQRIGWLADMVHGPAGVRGNAVQWMLPPCFQQGKGAEA